MAFELVYTSAPKGIRIGSSGFCVVACTNGLSANLVSQMEGLSAYKPYFPHYDASAALNPVAYSHYIYTSSGQLYHILSRICFNGLDYTKRSNKLAHHLALSSAEARQAADGPSAVFHQEGLFLTQWNAEPALIPSQKMIHAPAVPLRRACIWEAYTGDAGWAGMLADAYCSFPDRPSFVIFDPLKHRDISGMLEEALILLPPEQRWNVTFNTYFTFLPAGHKCAWRFCVPGSDVLRDARRTPGTLVIDLTKPLPEAPAGELQEMARTGKAPDVKIVLNQAPVKKPDLSLPDGNRKSENRKQPPVRPLDDENESGWSRIPEQMLHWKVLIPLLLVLIAGAAVFALFLPRGPERGEKLEKTEVVESSSGTRDLLSEKLEMKKIFQEEKKKSSQVKEKTVSPVQKTVSSGSDTAVTSSVSPVQKTVSSGSDTAVTSSVSPVQKTVSSGSDTVITSPARKDVVKTEVKNVSVQSSPAERAVPEPEKCVTVPELFWQQKKQFDALADHQVSPDVVLAEGERITGLGIIDTNEKAKDADWYYFNVDEENRCGKQKQGLNLSDDNWIFVYRLIFEDGVYRILAEKTQNNFKISGIKTDKAEYPLRFTPGISWISVVPDGSFELCFNEREKMVDCFYHFTEHDRNVGAKEILELKVSARIRLKNKSYYLIKDSRLVPGDNKRDGYIFTVALTEIQRFPEVKEYLKQVKRLEKLKRLCDKIRSNWSGILEWKIETQKKKASGKEKSGKRSEQDDISKKVKEYSGLLAELNKMKQPKEAEKKWRETDDYRSPLSEFMPFLKQLYPASAGDTSFPADVLKETDYETDIETLVAAAGRGKEKKQRLILEELCRGEGMLLLPEEKHKQLKPVKKIRSITIKDQK